jgi:ligand-binding sensor domain-containing protein/nitrogen-specific signal transduction histidine kinase
MISCPNKRNRYALLRVGLCLLAALCCLTNASAYKFESYTTEDGLSHNWVNDVLRDSQGFLWVATQYGLNRYDGYKFATYLHDPKDANSISGNRQVVMLEDDAGRIWVAADASFVDLYVPESDGFIPIPFAGFEREHKLVVDDMVQLDSQRIWLSFRNAGVLELNPNTREMRALSSIYPDLPFRFVRTMSVTTDGKVWLGCEGSGIVCYDTQTDVFSTHAIPGYEGFNEMDLVATTKKVFADEDGSVWISNDQGHPLSRYFPNSGEVIHFPVANDGSGLSYREVKDVVRFDESTVWIATDNGGINAYDETSGTFRYITHHPQDPYSVSSNGIYKIQKDQFGIVWLATFDGGVSYFDPAHNRFEHYYSISGASSGLSWNNVLDFAEDSTGRIWIGTDGGGLQLFDPHSETFLDVTEYLPEAILDLKFVTAVYITSDNKLVVGTFLEGVWVYDFQTKHYRQYSMHTTEGVFASSFWDIAETADGTILLASHYIATLDAETGEVGSLVLKMDEVRRQQPDVIESVHVGPDGVIYWGSRFGLRRYDPNNKAYRFFRIGSDSTGGLPSAGVTSIAHDSAGNLWVGTGEGLCRWDSEVEQFFTYGTSEGFPSNMICGILPVSEDEIWVSTVRGLCRFNPNSGAVSRFHPGYGLQGWQYNVSSGLIDREGRLYFGGVNGFNTFYPDSIVEEKRVPNVVFTQFKVDYQDQLAFTPSGPSHIGAAKRIELGPDERNFSIEFASLDITNVPYLRYRFMLEGHDKDWIEVASDENRAHYSKLAGGDYTLRVQSTNVDGKWMDNQQVLGISINPPVYQTLWFKVLVIAGCCIVVFVVHNYRLHFLVEARKKAEHADKLKSQFLANMSHEIRTPLNAMMGFLSVLEEEKDSARRRELHEHIHQSSEDLLHKIEDILDISSLESGAVKIYHTPLEINEVLNELHTVFDAQIKALGKDIQLELQRPQTGSIIIEADKLRFRQVLKHLLTNAVKFTEKGTISFGYELRKDSILFTVSDTGIGIRKSAIKSIFRPFIKVEEDVSKLYRGTGLGLAICERYLQMMGGEMGVTSIKGQGSSFWFRLPYNPESHAQEARLDKNKTQDEIPQLASHHIAIAEDDAMNRKVLELILAKTGAKLYWAENGKELVDLISRHSEIELVLTDIRMPVMDGLEAMREILSQRREIPIIVQSAYAMAEDKDRAFNAGCIDFITKPIRRAALYDALKSYL